MHTNYKVAGMGQDCGETEYTPAYDVIQESSLDISRRIVEAHVTSGRYTDPPRRRGASADNESPVRLKTLDNVKLTRRGGCVSSYCSVSRYFGQGSPQEAPRGGRRSMGQKGGAKAETEPFSGARDSYYQIPSGVVMQTSTSRPTTHTKHRHHVYPITGPLLGRVDGVVSHGRVRIRTWESCRADDRFLCPAQCP